MPPAVAVRPANGYKRVVTTEWLQTIDYKRLFTNDCLQTIVYKRLFTNYCLQTSGYKVMATPKLVSVREFREWHRQINESTFVTFEQ